MGLLDIVAELLRPVSVWSHRESYRQLVENSGFSLQGVSSNSDAFKNGLRYVHILPDNLWINWSGNIATTELGNEVLNLTPQKYLARLKKCAEESAGVYGLQALMSEPSPAACGVMVVYLGIK